MEAELKAIADKICAHFDLTSVGVNIAEQEREINGRYVPKLAFAPAQIAHYGDPIEYDWLFDSSTDKFSDRLRQLGIDL